MKKGEKLIIAGTGLVIISTILFFWRRSKGKSKHEKS
tara:strand:+ start:2911 stop:3021 length:111 start_codon:yes stop_codon:yes gene_type:complete